MKIFLKREENDARVKGDAEARRPLLSEARRPLLSPPLRTQVEESENFESLDFEQVHNHMSAEERRRSAHQRRFYGYTGRTFLSWACALAIGLLLGILAYILETFSKKAIRYKMTLAAAAMADGNFSLAFLYYSGYGAVCVVVTSIVVLYYAPAAAGGGVTLVIANLNGIHIPELLDFRTLVVKFFGTMCAITSGLAVGPEGPLVHIGAAMASQITSLSGRFSRLEPRTTKLRKNHSPDGPRRESPHAERESYSVPAGADPCDGAPHKDDPLLSTSPPRLTRETSNSSTIPSLVSVNSLCADGAEGSSPPNFDVGPLSDTANAVAPAPEFLPGNILASLDAGPDPILRPRSHVPLAAPGRVEEITVASEPSSRIGTPLARRGHAGINDVNLSEESELLDDDLDLDQYLQPSPSFFSWLTRPSQEALDFHNDVDCRAFISAGAAAGLAAAFGAPVGGILFSLEEASTFWCRKVLWRCFVCSAVACLVLALVRGGGRLERTGLLAFHYLRPELAVSDLPFLVITAAATGLLGGMFSRVHDCMGPFRAPLNKKFSRVVEASVILMMSIGIMFCVPLWFGKCLPQPKEWKEDNFGFEFLCPQFEGQPKQYNDMASLFFSIPDEAIKKLLELSSGGPNGTEVTPSQFSMSTLAIFVIVYFFVFQLAYGIAMPGGLFMPAVMLGGTFGALSGCVLQSLFPGWNIQPGHHALIGATAMLGGIFRASISLVVIMVEGTGGIDFMFPIIMAVIVSNYVAGHFGHMGAYESDLEKQCHVYFLHSEPPHALASLTAKDLMSRNVVGLDKIVRVSEVLQKLRLTQHNGFPVFTMSSTSHQRKQLVGLILRTQLLTLLEHRAFISYKAATRGYSHQLMRHMEAEGLMQPITTRDLLLHRAMRIYHLFHHPENRHLSSTPKAVDALSLDWVERRNVGRERQDGSQQGDIEEGSATWEGIGTGVDTDDLALDLGPYMNTAPLSVRQECFAHRVYVIFRALGQRHLLVTDAESSVVGMITRKDLAMAARIGNVIRGSPPRRAEGNTSPHFAQRRVSYHSLP